MGLLEMATGSVLNMAITVAITIIGMGLVIYLIAELMCQVPAAGAVAVTALRAIPVLGWPATFASCGMEMPSGVGDVINMGDRSGIPGGGTTYAHDHAGASIWETLPALETLGEWGSIVATPMTYLSELLGNEVQLSQPCRVAISVLYDAIRSPELVDTPEKLSWLADLAEWWLGERNPFACFAHAGIQANAAADRGHLDLCSIIQQSKINLAPRLGSRQVGLSDLRMPVVGTTEALELLDVMLCGGKFVSLFCKGCGGDVSECRPGFTCRAPRGDESCGDVGPSMTFKRYSGVPGEDSFSSTEVTLDGSTRCLPTYDCGSGLNVGVGGKRCGAGSYCKHAAGSTVGNCAALPAALANCSDGSGCPSNVLGPGWACINGQCKQQCGYLGLPGTDKSKCLCKSGVDVSPDEPYGRSPGYKSVLLAATDLDNPEFAAQAAYFGIDRPSLGRQIVGSDVAAISGQLLMSDGGYIHVVKFGVKYWVDSAKLPAALRSPASSSSPGSLRRWSTYTDRGLPDRNAKEVFIDWDEVIRRLDHDVPYPDGTFSSRTEWEVTEVYPDFYKLVPYSIAEALDVPYLTHSADYVASRIARLIEAASWGGENDAPAFSWNVWTPFSRADPPGTVMSTLKNLAIPQCAEGEVVTGLKFAGLDGHGGSNYAIRCSAPPPGGPGVITSESDIPIYGAHPGRPDYGSSTAAMTGGAMANSGPAYARMRSLGFGRHTGAQAMSHRLPIGKRYTTVSDGQSVPLWDDAVATKTLTIQLSDTGTIRAGATSDSVTAACPDGWAVHELGSDHTGKITVKCSDLRR